VRSRPDSFSWSEDEDGPINFWVWAFTQGDVSESSMLERVEAQIAAHPFAPFEYLTKEPRWSEFEQLWSAWRRAWAERAIAEASRRIEEHERDGAHVTEVLREHYKAVAEVGLNSFRVHWVMAPFGRRWLFPPDVLVLGAEGAEQDKDRRRQAVLEAARALRTMT
jgi:hypothetical protein